MTVIVRPGTEKDVPFLLQAAGAADSTAVIKQKRGLNADYLRRDIFCDKPKAHALVAELDGQVVASFLYSFFYLGSVGQVIWITKLYIDPFCRKMNIGQQMRDYLFTTYPDVPAIYGSVVPTNKLARVFFTSLGAEPLNENYIFYKLEDGTGRV